MLIVGKMEEVAREMKEFRIGILVLQQIRWKVEGRADKENYTLFYGARKGKGRLGLHSWWTRSLGKML